MPDTEPISFFAGSTVEWSKTLEDYTPDDGWTLHYRFRGPQSHLVSDAYVVDDGTKWDISIPASITIAYGAGDYTLYGWVTNADSESYIVTESRITIKADPRTTGGSHDPRSIEKKIFDAINNALNGIASREEQSYSIQTPSGERTIEFCSRTELIAMRSYFQGEVERQERLAKIEKGLPAGNKINIRFR